MKMVALYANHLTMKFMVDDMTKKDSFLIYKAFYKPIESYNDDQLGRLFRALFNFQISGNRDVDKDIETAFLFFVNQFNIDTEKYEKVCEQNRQNALRRSKKGIKKEDKKEVKVDKSETIEHLYNLYPTKCPINERSTGKGKKDKVKIEKIIKEISPETLEETIIWYVNDCKKTNTFLKSFSTFLNNLPDLPNEGNINMQNKNEEKEL